MSLAHLEKHGKNDKFFPHKSFFQWKNEIPHHYFPTRINSPNFKSYYCKNVTELVLPLAAPYH